MVDIIFVEISAPWPGANVEKRPDSPIMDLLPDT